MGNREVARKIAVLNQAVRLKEGVDLDQIRQLVSRAMTQQAVLDGVRFVTDQLGS